jgi:hypothetical protein
MANRLSKPRSERQIDRTVPRTLTRRHVLRMMALSPARGRRGLTRGVLRTSVPGAGQPSQRADWARPSEPAEASRLRSPPGSVLCHVKNGYGTLTWTKRCATIPPDPKSRNADRDKEGGGFGETTPVRGAALASTHRGRRAYRLPRNRMGGQGKRVRISWPAPPRTEQASTRFKLASRHGLVRRLWH